VVLVVCIVVFGVGIITTIVDGDKDDNDEGNPLMKMVGLVIVILFIADVTIQSCIVRGTQADCCGTLCGCECGCLLGSKLIFDSIYLATMFLEAVAEAVISTGGHGSLKIVRAVRLLFFGKIGLEIAAVVVLCMHARQQTPDLKQIGIQPVTVVGQAVTVKGDEP